SRVFEPGLVLDMQMRVDDREVRHQRVSLKLASTGLSVRPKPGAVSLRLMKPSLGDRPAVENVPEDFDRNLGEVFRDRPGIARHGDGVFWKRAGMGDDENVVRPAGVGDLLGAGDAERKAEGQVRHGALGERALSDRIASPKGVGSTSLSLPAFGLGTAHLGELYGKVAEVDSDATMQAAWDAGVRYYDTAPWYGRGLSEHRLGGVLRPQPPHPFPITSQVC